MRDDKLSKKDIGSHLPSYLKRDELMGIMKNMMDEKIEETQRVNKEQRAVIEGKVMKIKQEFDMGSLR